MSAQRVRDGTFSMGVWQDPRQRQTLRSLPLQLCDLNKSFHQVCVCGKCLLGRGLALSKPYMFS